MTLRRETVLALLFVAGFLVRLGLVLALRDINTMPAGASSADDIEFNVLAQHLAEGKGFTNHADRATSFRAPAWPIFMAGVYSLCGQRAAAIYVSSCLLGAVTCVLAYLIGRRLMGERLGRIAGALCVVFLPHAYFATWFWSENLFVPLFAAAVWVLLRAIDLTVEASGGRKPPECASLESGDSFRGLTPPARQEPTGGLTPRRSPSADAFVLWVALAGLLLGAAALTRPFALLAVPLFAIVLLWYRGRRGFVEGTILGLMTAFVVAPWTYRNYLVHDRFVLVATNGGSTFYGGNNDRVVSEYRQFGSWLSTVELPGRDEIVAAPDEVTHDKVEWRLGREWVTQHPGKALFTLPLKLARLVLWLPDFDTGRFSLVIRAAGYLPFLALILVGLWRGRRELAGPGWWLLHASMLATAFTAFIFWGSPRFRDANAPLLLAYAALAFIRKPARSPIKQPSDQTPPSSEPPPPPS